MKKLLILLTLALICTSTYSESILICGTFKLTGYYDDGNAYSGIINITKTDNGIIVKGVMNGYLKESNEYNGCVSYRSSDFSKEISFCVDGSISISHLEVADDDIFNPRHTKEINDVHVTRIH